MFVFVFYLSNLAGDDKKHMTVRAEGSAQQINNHPWSYTTTGQGNTNCSTTGTVNATTTDTGYGTTSTYGTGNTDTTCRSTYTPPQTVQGNRITVDNASWVTDLATGDQYLIECTAGWAGSKCSYLAGGTYVADLKGNTLSVTGMKGMKQITAKYKVIRYVPAASEKSPTSQECSVKDSQKECRDVAICSSGGGTIEYCEMMHGHSD